MKKLFMKLLLVFCLVLGLFTTGATQMVQAENTEEEKELLQELLLYYTNYRNDGTYQSDYSSTADYDIDRILQTLSDGRDGKKGNKDLSSAWKQILDYWDDALYPFHDGFTVNEGILPDGLPNDNTLAIVCLGYALNSTTGEMEDELIGRLQVTLDSYHKYPESIIAVTGGGTAPNSAHPEHTEGGEMKKWLVEHGVSEDKIICEDTAKDTLGNARNTYAIIKENYPQITSVAIVSSSYHVPRGSVLFEAQFLETAAENHEECPIHVISNAGYYVEKPNYASNGGYEGFGMFTFQVPSIAGVSLSAGGWPPQPLPAPDLSEAEKLCVRLSSNKVTLGQQLQFNARSKSYVLVASGDDFSNDYLVDYIDDNSKISITGYDPNKLGDQEVTFTYTWKEGTIYEKTLTDVQTVRVIESREEQLPVLKELLLYYTKYREGEKYNSPYSSEADYDIDRVLEDLSEINEYEGEAWAKIIEYWDDALYPFHDGFTVNEGVLPDGLPNNNTLAIVCLGYALNSTTGEMEDELIGRLQVTLDSWRKYPNSIIAVTGGGTALNSAHPEHTEGSEMKKWLIEQGVPEDQIICEDRAGDTLGNATNTYRIIQKDYPQITSVAIVSSSYHVPRGSVLFEAQFLQTAAENKEECKIHVVSNAGYYVDKPNYASNGGYEGFSMFTFQVPSIAGVSIGRNDPTPALSAAGDELNVELEDNEIVKGKEPVINSATFPIIIGDDLDDDYDENAPVGEIAVSGFDPKTEGEQEVTFSYIWREGTAYEKTVTGKVTVNVVGKASEYVCTVGKNSSWDPESTESLNFKVNRTNDDESTFDRFKALYVDGEKLIKDVDYTVSKGSLNISLYAEYLQTLAKGKHKMTVEFTDKSIVIPFNIGKSTPKPDYTLPKTGI